MPKLPRVTVVEFGNSGASTAFGQFSSKTVGSPQTSKLPAIIMQLAGWLTGWTAAAVGADFNPYLEDMNGFCFATFYFLANIFERGIPDWDAGTTYYRGAYVQDPAGSGQRFYSLTDNNLNNALPLGASNAQWHWDNPPPSVDGGLTVGFIPLVSAITPATLVNSHLTDDGVDIKTTLPLKFPDNTVQSTAAVNNAPTVQNVVTGSRALNTSYQNTTSKPIYVSVVVALGNGQTVAANTDAAPTPTTVLQAFGNAGASGANASLFMIVLPGNYYSVTGSGSMTHWTETT